ncbi:hypothetical protein LCGC14_2645290 [marine sediment metagenome]|uniref:Uncharacterized protein n=1 Tax=marine sediment metagenome TaxID=412755 RepID=A0A0F9C6V1_9ZZZZ
MSNFKSRADFLRNNPSASAFAALADATKQQKNVTDSAIKLKPGQLAGKKVVVIGSGDGGFFFIPVDCPGFSEFLYGQSPAELHRLPVV